ncbi:MAG: ATP-binding protein [Thermodesulfovibrionales bacterium]|nr:ATP-binding protein [Thermodesulfovibrionales bacterium]
MNKKSMICFFIGALLLIAALEIYFKLPRFISYLLIIVSFITIWFLWSERLKGEINRIINFLYHIRRHDFDNRDAGIIPDRENRLGDILTGIMDLASEFEIRLRELKKEKETLEKVFQNMKEGVLIIGDDNRVVLLNRGLQELLGFGNPYKDMTVTEILREAELISLMEDARSLKGSITREIPLRDGRHLSVTASPVEFGIMMTFYDITRIKRLEQVRRDFVANVAHEIKTPITAIKGFAETLLDGAMEDRENAEKFLEIIKKHSERLNSLVSDLLTLSAIEQGEIRLELIEIHLSELVDSLFLLMEEKAKAKGLYLKKMVPEETVIRADRDRLSQILLNLIDNGIKFTEFGGVTVGAYDSGGRITIFVEDTGCGIEKKHLSRLGERFYRVDRARSRELGGTGLGLAIVKHLVKAHGWDMEIESTPGKGTKVKIITG